MAFGETVTCHHLEKCWRKDGRLARKPGQCPRPVDPGPGEREGGRNRMNKTDSKAAAEQCGWLLGLATTKEEGGTKSVVWRPGNGDLAPG